MIYENVRYFAGKRNMSITQVEKKAGLSNGTVGKWARYPDRKPNIDTIEKVADVLKVSVATLIREGKYEDADSV